MSEHLSEDARREAARKRLQERQAREQAENAAERSARLRKAARNDHAPEPDRTENPSQAHRISRAPQPGAENVAPKRRITREEAHGKRPAPSRPSGGKRCPSNRLAGTSRPADARGHGANDGFASNARNAYSSLCKRYGKRNVLIAAGIAVVLLIAVVFCIRTCTIVADPEQAALNEAERAVSTASYSNDDGSKPIQSDLVGILGNDDAAKLLDAASSSADVYWIASHPDSFMADGSAVQAKLLKLAANEPDAVSFVREWSDKYPQDAPSGDAGAPSAESGTSIPRLYQWDVRWGYTVYSSTSFALTGCCPTALAMVYQGLTGNTDKSPYDMGLLARNGGYETQYDGTDGTFLVETADQLGLSCTQLTPMASNVTSTLSAGQVLIINVGPGDFTTSGHYIVACGLDDDGKVIVNDPYSAERSNKTWDVSTLVDQAKAIYAYSA